VDIALKWQSLGAPRIHVIDLDGAARGELVNLDLIKQLATVMTVPIELGGGIRQLETIDQLLKVGIDRVILGTVAVENPDMIKEACRRFGDAIVVGIDTREGLVAIQGWQLETKLTGVEFAKSMMALGVKRFIYTDINRDGTLTEPNFTAITEMREDIRVPIIAAGGISSITHLKILKMIGVEGAIVGKALYSGAINLKQALATIN
jgi:phosphoribosylformimino-5-aminoimidazole carboxamide ribotide isomerase